MYISVLQLAEKINNIKHFTQDELQKPAVFEIDILDNEGNIIYRHYKACKTKEQAQINAKNACDHYKNQDKKYYQYRIIKIKNV